MRAPGHFIRPGWGERSSLRRLPLKVSVPFHRRDWRTIPLFLCPRAAGGLGSSSANLERARASVARTGRWGDLWASGARRTHSGQRVLLGDQVEGKVPALIKPTWSLNLPPRQTRRQCCRRVSYYPLTPLDPSSSTWVPVELSDGTFPSESCRSERDLHRGEGFGRVSMKNNQWRPPALALCMSSPRRFILY